MKLSISFSVPVANYDWPVFPQEKRFRPGMRALAAEVAERSGVPVKMILGRDRRRVVAHARQALMAAMIDAGYGYSQTGHRLGFHHTTVIHAVRKVRERAQK